MIKLTKQQLTDLFNSSKSYEDMAADFTSQNNGVEINAKMVQDLFKANGFNLRSRTRKPKASWYTVIDDTPSNSTGVPAYDSFNAQTDDLPEKVTEEVA